MKIREFPAVSGACGWLEGEAFLYNPRTGGWEHFDGRTAEIKSETLSRQYYILIRTACDVEHCSVHASTGRGAMALCEEHARQHDAQMPELAIDTGPECELSEEEE